MVSATSVAEAVGGKSEEDVLGMEALPPTRFAHAVVVLVAHRLVVQVDAAAHTLVRDL